ncbi:MAG TPA: ribonuclease HII [Clostridiaceae bacterium]
MKDQNKSEIKKLLKAYKECERVISMYDLDISYEVVNLAGIDEVGRGPLAGPIVAAAVILPIYNKKYIMGLNDSKKLSFKRREELSLIIKATAMSFKIEEIDNISIDTKGLTYANQQVFKNSCDNLDIVPDLVLTDGYPIKNFHILNKYLIKGDEKSASIAAASIIAKDYRDKLMKKWSLIYPEYGFDHNAGYGTKEHIIALLKYGPSPIHRTSFIKGIMGQ